MSPTAPPLLLVTGPEEVLADRAVEGAVSGWREQDGDLDLVRLRAADYEPGSLAVHASPSLFGGGTVLVVHDLDEASDDLVQDLEAYLAAPAEHVRLAVRHKGGNRGKRVLDALKRAGARVVEAKALKSERDKVQFVKDEFRTARRKIAEPAVLALVHAVGKDLRELASACASLVRDTTGVVDVDVVETYYGGKVETTGFKVAEAALAGDQAQALRLLRHAVIGGLDPVPIVAVLASQLRQVGRVASQGLRANPQAVARDLGMAPWQVQQAQRTARGWDGARLGLAIQAVAAADVETKGGVRTAHDTVVARDPVYALERAVLTVCRLRQEG